MPNKSQVFIRFEAPRCKYACIFLGYRKSNTRGSCPVESEYIQMQQGYVMWQEWGLNYLRSCQSERPDWLGSRLLCCTKGCLSPSYSTCSLCRIWLINYGLSVNEQYFSLTPNQPTALSASQTSPNEKGVYCRHHNSGFSFGELLQTLCGEGAFQDEEACRF